MTPKTNTTPIWNLRNEIVNARIDAAGISDVLTRYEVAFELHEQAALLAELAEAIESGADTVQGENDGDDLCECMIMTRCPSHRRYDPRTIWEQAADKQDADRYDQIADSRREARFGVGL
jgi:hypothetical protein